LVPAQAHNLFYVGSSPASATRIIRNPKMNFQQTKPEPKPETMAYRHGFALPLLGTGLGFSGGLL